MEIEVYWILNYGPGRIGIIPRPRGGDWLEDEIRGLRSAGAEVLVSLLTEQEVEELDLAQEPTLCAQNGIEFLSFGIEDRGVPALDSDTTRFLGEVTARLLEKKAVVVHCHMGIGRSALLAACLLASRRVAVGEAFKLIADARGCPVPDTPEQQAWVDSYAKNVSLQRTDVPTELEETGAGPD